jgi:uncharacterized protein (TIRG00374 family)
MSSIVLRRFWKPGLLVWLALPLALWWFARDIPLSDWRQIVQSIRPQQLSLLVIVNLAGMFFISLRWWLILFAMGWRVPYFSILRYRMAAFSVSYFTPGTQFGGEPLQVLALEKRHSLPRSAALASVTAEKLFELLANFSFLAVGVTLVLRNRLLDGSSPILVVLWTAALLALPLIYLALLGLDRRPVSHLLSRLPASLESRHWIQRIRGLASDTEAQVANWVRCSPRTVLLVVLASLWFWVLSLAEYWLALHVLGATLTLSQTIIALTAARIAFLMPVPAGLGALETGQVLALQALGFSPALGIAISLWIRVRDLLLGALGLVWSALLVQSRPIAALSAETGD